MGRDEPVGKREPRPWSVLNPKYQFGVLPAGKKRPGRHHKQSRDKAAGKGSEARKRELAPRREGKLSHNKPRPEKPERKPGHPNASKRDDAFQVENVLDKRSSARKGQLNASLLKEGITITDRKELDSLALPKFQADHQYGDLMKRDPAPYTVHGHKPERNLVTFLPDPKSKKGHHASGEGHHPSGVGHHPSAHGHH